MQNNNIYIAGLIKRQWIREEYVASDLFTLDVIDSDFVGGYKPMILTMESLREILIDSISFIDLPDTPSTYVGESGQVPIVNATEDGLEFALYIDEFIELTDTPLDYIGAAGLPVYVNLTEDGLVFGNPIPQEIHYEARVRFDDVNQPTVDQLQADNLGVSILWTRTAIGIFQATFSGLVDPDKLTTYIGNSSSGFFTIGSYNTGSIQYIHRDFTGTLSDPSSVICAEIKLFP